MKINSFLCFQSRVGIVQHFVYSLHLLACEQSGSFLFRRFPVHPQISRIPYTQIWRISESSPQDFLSFPLSCPAYIQNVQCMYTSIRQEKALWHISRLSGWKGTFSVPIWVLPSIVPASRRREQKVKVCDVIPSPTAQAQTVQNPRHTTTAPWANISQQRTIVSQTVVPSACGQIQLTVFQDITVCQLKMPNIGADVAGDEHISHIQYERRRRISGKYI